MASSQEEIRRLAVEASKKLADKGQLVEAGWVGFEMLVLSQGMTKAQIDDYKLAFMAGAQHLFASIMTILDPDGEPTEADLRKMDLINRELDGVSRQLQMRMTKPKGSA